MGVGLDVGVPSDEMGAGVAASSLGIGVRAADELSLVAPGPHAAETRIAIANTSTTSQGNLRFGIKGALRPG